MDAMPTAKLPVFSTLVSSWGSVPRNLGLAFRLYWPWAAVCTVAGAAWGTVTATGSRAIVSSPDNAPLWAAPSGQPATIRSPPA